MGASGDQPWVPFGWYSATVGSSSALSRKVPMQSSTEASKPPRRDSQPGQTNAAQTEHGEPRVERDPIATSSLEFSLAGADTLDVSRLRRSPQASSSWLATVAMSESRNAATSLLVSAAFVTATTVAVPRLPAR